MSTALVDDLRLALPLARIINDIAMLQSYRRDHLLDLEVGTPAAVLLATSTDDVATAVLVAGRHAVGVIARGAGSGLAGGASAVDGCLIISLERMNRIVAVDVANQTALVEPGVINSAVSEVAAADGLWFPPDPASRDYCTIGGNVATNAGGMCCVKYGVTRDYVLALEVVLADGSVIWTGHRTIKGVAGLDLTGLFVGSEGTLGIITKVLLRLRPRPPVAATIVASFASLSHAGDAVETLIASHLDLSLIEIMDSQSVALVNDWGRFNIDDGADALLLLQCDDPPAHQDVKTEQISRICQDAGATDVFFSRDEAEAEALLQARRVIGLALEGLGKRILPEDISVPRSAVAEMIGEIVRLSEHYETRTVTYGHAGDGNLHPVLIVEDGPEAEARGEALFEAIMAAALRLGGTITGEHGVGQWKSRYLAGELGERNLELQRAIKLAVDPQSRFIAGGWLDPTDERTVQPVNLRENQGL